MFESIKLKKPQQQQKIELRFFFADENLAKYRRTCQSTTETTLMMRESWLAVDDLNGTNASVGQCSHTNEGDTGNNWFMVDLNEVVIISYVRILARDAINYDNGEQSL